MAQQLLVNGLIAGAVYALIALGFSLIYRTVRFFHFAHGVLYTVGAYVAYTCVATLGLHFALAFLISCGSVAVLGVLVDRVVYARLRRRKAGDLVFLIASFGVLIFLQNLLQLIYGVQVRRLSVGQIREGHHVLGAVVTDTQLFIIGLSGLLTFVLWVVMQKTQMGKAIRAVSDDMLGASVVGINPERIIMSAFALGSALAAAAGILVAMETNIDPTMGLNAILKGIVAAILGGFYSLPGAFLGALVLGLVENLSLYVIPAAWKDAITYVILLIVLLWRPSGMLGGKMAAERL